MTVIGIDPGTALTGYGIVGEKGDGSLQLITYGVVRTKSHMRPEDRLKQIYTELNEILTLHKLESGAVERLFFQRNTTTAISVGQARGVAMLSLAQAGLTVYEYTPVEIKQAVAGYGRAPKKQVQQMVKTLLEMNEIPQPDDAADALATAICHLHSRKMLRYASA